MDINEHKGIELDGFFDWISNYVNYEDKTIKELWKEYQEVM